jgi:beta-galactosidase
MRPRLIPGFNQFLHGGDYNPDQWLGSPEILDQDLALMADAGITTVSVGIFAWNAYEPREGVFTFDWMDRLLDRLAEAGIRAILATPSGAKPGWMARKYPEIRRMDRQGLRKPQEGRHNHCWSSPVYRGKVVEMNTRLAERYGKHPALGMWHLSNEYGGDCYCELCIQQFRGWLQRRYQTLDALNEAWWSAFWSHQVSDWADIEPRDFVLDAMMLDWQRFNTWQVCDFMDLEAGPLRRITPDVPITTNFMGFYGGLDYSELAKHVDLIADDQYPAYSPFDPDLQRTAAYISMKDDLYRCFKPDRPWMLMESCPDSPQWKNPRTLKRPGLHQAEMLQAIGHGAEGTCYFQWRAGRGGLEKLHGAVVDGRSGSDTRVFQVVAEHSRELAGLTGVLGTEPTPAKIAILFDWESRWAFDLTDGVAKVDDAVISRTLDHYLPFWERGIPVDVVRSDADLSPYTMVITPQLWMLREGVAESFKEFVNQGGTLVSTHYTGWVDSNNKLLQGGYPGNGLMALFGIWNEETDWLPRNVSAPLNVHKNNSLLVNAELQALDVRAILHATSAEMVATYTDQFYAGTPAITSHSVGNGRAVYIGAKMPVGSLRRFYEPLIGSLHLAPCIQGEWPRGVSVQRRGHYVFLQNWTDQDVQVALREKGFPTSVDLNAFHGKVTMAS